MLKIENLVVRELGFS